MRHRIVHAPAFRLVGRSARIPLVHEGVNQPMVDFVEAVPDHVSERMLAVNDRDPRGLLGASLGFEQDRADGSLHDFWHAVATTGPTPAGLETLDVPAGTWAVFATAGRFPEALQQMWRDAFGEWFPSNPYRTVPGRPELLSAEDDAEGGCRGELWLPVERVIDP